MIYDRSKFLGYDKAIVDMSDQEILDILHEKAEDKVNPNVSGGWDSSNFDIALAAIKQRLIDDGCAAHPDLVPIAEIMATHGHRYSKVYAQHIVDHFYRQKNEWRDILSPTPADKGLQRTLSQRSLTPKRSTR